MNDHPPVTNVEVVRALQQNWRAEKESAQLYRELAVSEKDAERKAVLLRLAEAEERHAARWEKRLSELGGNLPTLSQDLKRRFNRWLNLHVGTDAAIRRLEAAEQRDNARYETQREKALSEDPQSPSILRELAREER